MDGRGNDSIGRDARGCVARQASTSGLTTPWVIDSAGPAQHLSAVPLDGRCGCTPSRINRLATCVPEVMAPNGAGEPRGFERRPPHAPPEVRDPQRSASWRSEQECVGRRLDRLEVRPELLDEEAGDPCLSHAVGLRPTEHRAAVHVGERLGDYQSTSIEIALVPSERGRLSPAQAPVKDVYQGPVASGYRGRQALYPLRW
jgi:hypothetical protein